MVPREDAIVVCDLLAAVGADILSESVQLRTEFEGMHGSAIIYRSSGACVIDRRPGEDARVEQLVQPLSLGGSARLDSGRKRYERVGGVYEKCM